MRIRLTAALAAGAAVAILLGGCAGISADAGSDPNNPNQVEVFTWWASGNEKSSFTTLVDVFQSQHADIQLIDASVRGSGGEQARAAIIARLESDNAPDSFQAAAGAGLTDYIEAGQIQDLTGWYADNGLSSGVYRSSLLELLSVDGKIYSVPLDIHRVNVVWSNTDVLTAAGVDPAATPTTIDAWIADLEKVGRRASSTRSRSAAAGRRPSCSRTCLVADLGAVLYQNLWKSTKNWEGERLQAAVAHYAQLLDLRRPRLAHRGVERGDPEPWSTGRPATS